MLTTDGHLLGGRLRYAQPATGFRTGIEPVLLAAAIPARPGDAVLEAGTGAGAGLMCLASRIPGLTGLGLEIDPATAALARRNAAANHFPNLSIIAGNILRPPLALHVQHAFANPPWHHPRATPSPDPARRRAKQAGSPGSLPWIAALAGLLAPGGTLTLCLPAAQAEAARQAMRAAGLGGTALCRLRPKQDKPAKLALLHGWRAPGTDRTDTDFVLHEADGRFTAATESILRHGAALPDGLLAYPC